MPASGDHPAKGREAARELPEPDPLFVQLAADIARPGALEVLMDAAAEREWMVVELDSPRLPHLLWCPPMTPPELEAWVVEHRRLGTNVGPLSSGWEHPILAQVDRSGSGRLALPAAASKLVRQRIWRVECHRVKGLRLHKPGEEPEPLPDLPLPRPWWRWW